MTNQFEQPPLVPHLSGEWSIEKYNPDLHDAAQLIAEQAWAVKTKQAQMLPWKTQQEAVLSPEGLPFFVITIGAVAVGGAGFNAKYMHEDGSEVAEVGGAYIAQNYRGNMMYPHLIDARLAYAKKQGLQLIVFANEASLPALSEKQFVVASDEQVPKAAFKECLNCEFNPVKGVVPTRSTCCDGESILILPNQATK